MPRPLEGYRVADFSHVMAGPFASHFLRLLGAEVIKVEAPGRGDAMRYYGPDRRYDGMAPGFIAANAGKKSIVLDLKQEGARDVARRLIAASDVVLENFRPGVMERLGFGYEACKALKPDIVFCSVSGYGQSGPLSQWPAIDNIVQATSGMMSLSGEAGGPPTRVGCPAVDTWAGLTAALAIVSALLQRERFGGAQYIAVAMLDSALVFMASAMVPYLVTGTPMERTGNTGYSAQPTAGMFRTRDGTEISLGAVQANQYETLLRVIGREDLLSDARFTTPDLRKKNAEALKAILAEVFLQKDGAEWERRLSEAGAPCGLVRDVRTASELPNLEERGVKIPLHIPGLPQREDIHVMGAGFLFEHDGPAVDQPPPRHGEHTAEVLEALGYDVDARAALQASGAAISGTRG